MPENYDWHGPLPDGIADIGTTLYHRVRDRAELSLSGAEVGPAAGGSSTEEVSSSALQGKWLSEGYRKREAEAEEVRAAQDAPLRRTAPEPSALARA